MAEDITWTLYNLIDSLRRSHPSIKAAFKKLEYENLRQEDRSLALSWLVFDCARKDLSLHVHLPMLANYIRDLTYPNIDIKLLRTMAEVYVKAGKSHHFIQHFLLPKLNSMLEDCGEPLYNGSRDSFMRLQHVRGRFDEKETLLKCFILAHRAEGNFPFALAATSALTSISLSCQPHLDLLSLHVTGIAKSRFLQQGAHELMQTDGSATVALIEDFHKAASNARNLFADADGALGQYYVHSLSLLGRHELVIEEYNRLVSKRPEMKERLLPWYLNTLTQTHQESLLEQEDWSTIVLNMSGAKNEGLEEGLKPSAENLHCSPTSLLEASEMLRFCWNASKFQDHSRIADATFNRALQAITSKSNSANASSSSDASAVTPSDHLDNLNNSDPLDLGTFNLIEATCALILSNPSSVGSSSKLSQLASLKTGSRTIVSSLASMLADSASARNEEGDAEKSILLFKELLPRLNSIEMHDMARCYEVIGDSEAALDLYMRSGGDQIGNRSRLSRSIVLAKLGLYDDALELYDAICDEKESYDPRHWMHFEGEWGLFFSGRRFLLGSSYCDLPPTRFNDYEKSTELLCRALETAELRSTDQERRLFNALFTCYNSLRNTGNPLDVVKFMRFRAWMVAHRSYGDPWEHDHGWPFFDSPLDVSSSPTLRGVATNTTL